MSKYRDYTDKEIILMVRNGGREFELISKYLVQAFRGFIPKVNTKYQLSDEAIRDAYTDALVKLIRHIKQGSFKGNSKISTYFFTIFQNTAVDVLRKQTSNKVLDTTTLHPYSAVERDLLKQLEVKSDVAHIRTLIHQLGATCQKILMDWGYYGYEMEEIAKRSNLSNAESARSMKYKCLKKLRALIATQNNTLTDGK